MNVESKTDAPKSKLVSIPFLLIAVVLLVGGYPAGKWVMKQVMLKQEEKGFTGEAVAPEGDVPRTGLAAMAEQRSAMGRPPGGGGGGGQSGGAGNFDPNELFGRMDADSNGKLEGEEISERMQGRVEAMDTDMDKAISKEEFLEAMKNRRGGGEGGERGQRPESDDSEDDADNDESDEDEGEGDKEKPDDQ